MTFYGGEETLAALIADPMGDPRKLVAEVERLCRREAHASAYYRNHPDLLFQGHPWLRFVATGEAQYLGWDPSEDGN